MTDTIVLVSVASALLFAVCTFLFNKLIAKHPTDTKCMMQNVMFCLIATSASVYLVDTYATETKTALKVFTGKASF